MPDQEGDATDQNAWLGATFRSLTETPVLIPQGTRITGEHPTEGKQIKVKTESPRTIRPGGRVSVPIRYCEGHDSEADFVGLHDMKLEAPPVGVTLEQVGVVISDDP